jgi:hypoxanthine phosphoribosyltransferase
MILPDSLAVIFGVCKEGVESRLFFLSQSDKEIAALSEDDPEAASFYTEFLESLGQAMTLYIHHYGPIPDDMEQTGETCVLPFNVAIDWAGKDWERLWKFIQASDNWLIVWVARGGLILLDELESRLDECMWTYFKPKSVIREHEDLDVFEEYTDPKLEAKIEEFSGEEISILYIDDIISDTENLNLAMEHILDKCEEQEVEVADMAVLSIMTRVRRIGPLPVFGVLTDYSGEIRAAWGNDSPDGLDEYDFSEAKETIDDHEI